MEEKVRVEGLDKLDLMLDALLIQTVKKDITYEEYLIIASNEEFYGEFQQLASWKKQYEYKFNIYNDHFIDGKKHFHFENKEKEIHLKLDFDGNILEKVGKNDIDSKTLKVLKKFLQQASVIEEWNKIWNKNNQ